VANALQTTDNLDGDLVQYPHLASFAQRKPTVPARS